MKKKSPSLEWIVLRITCITALGLYFGDVFIDWLFFYHQPGFIAAFTKVSPQEHYSRFQLIVFISLLGGFWAYFIRRKRKKEEVQWKQQVYTRTLMIHQEMDQLKLLRGLLPICSSCKKIRDRKGHWTGIESYIHAHAPVEFSHSLCPECARRLYPELDFGGRQLTLDQEGEDI